MAGAVNYATTVVTMRAPGLTMMRLPLSIWALFIAALLQLFALPVLTAASIEQLLDRLLHTGFFTPSNLVVNQMNPELMGGAAGGQPLLWQHLFWFYSHPAVYIMVVPAMGLASDILSVHSRKPVFGYKPMVYSMAAIAGLGFIVWGHHMFASGMNPALGMTFMVSTILIALPSAIKVFNWLGTLWGARIQLTTANLNAIAFVALFIIGGLSGIWMAATPVDIYMHDTYIIVAHFHYVVFGGSVFAIYGAIHHWFPKMFGRLMCERLGKIHFVGSFIFANCTFYMMHQIGLAGLMRRTADPYAYEVYAHLQPLNEFISISAFCLFLWQGIFVFNFFNSIYRGKRIGRNPWKANTLEWDAPSPPGHGNFDREVRVYRGPYEYASPLVEEDYLPQTRNID
jgi:cytochrome c oxidase subunit 1